MLRIVLPEQDSYDEAKELFISTKEESVELEHSLLSLSKWESKFKKPFLSSAEKTDIEILEYVKLMVINEIPENFILRLTTEIFEQINQYIDSSESATTFASINGSGGKSEIITSELIYFWMVNFSIPFSCETWHLNRLFNLIRIAGIKNSPPKKTSAAELARRNRELNEQRKAKLGTTG